MSLAMTTSSVLQTVQTAAQGRAILDRVRTAVAQATFDPEVPVDRIRPMANQPRKYFNPDKLLRLSESIKSIGQITPGYLRMVRTDADGRDRELVDGERRWQAILMGGMPTFRAMIVQVDDEAAQFIMSVIANFNREGHTPMEVADAIRVSHEQLKLSMEEIGEMIGFSAVYCNNLYGLRRLTHEVRELLDPNRGSNRKLPVTAAIEISRLPAQYQMNVANRLLKREINLRGVHQEVISVSERHGLPVQTRWVDPHRYRLRLQEKISLVKRTNADLKKRLEEADPSVLNGWSKGALMGYRGELETAREALAASIREIDRAIRKKP